jgi:hypothetical protein
MSAITTSRTVPISATNGVIADLIIIIGGYASEDAGNSEIKPLPAMPQYSASGDLLRRVQGGELTPASGHVIQPLGLKGQMIDTDVQAAVAFIQNAFDPRGKLILCGHSMGGAAVQDVCRALDSTPFWDPTRNSLTAVPNVQGDLYRRGLGLSPTKPGQLPPQALPNPSNASYITNPRIAVDLLLTTDAAIGNFSSFMDRSIARCVRTNLNYYQTKRKDYERSCGGPNVARDQNSTIVWNHDLTNRAIPDADLTKPAHTPDHQSIQAQLNNMYMKIMQQALTTDRVTDYWDIPPSGL